MRRPTTTRPDDPVDGHIPTGGFVSLVGAGPGDPELLTVRAWRAICAADAIVHDQLVGPEVLALASRHAERFYAGKHAGSHAMPQPEINALLVALARRGLRVVRLKGGDPYIFGRGGEEAEYLLDHGVAFEVVPGITSASAAAAYGGIPLTHRDHAQACVFVTGHRKAAAGGGCDLDWPALARPHQTVVVYMGLAAVAEICAKLIEHGRAPDTPAAAVERASTPSQRVVTATLATLPERIAQMRVRPPALLVIGEVVALQQRLGRPSASRKTAVKGVAGSEPLEGVPLQSL